MPDRTATSPAERELTTLDNTLAALSARNIGLESTTPAQLHAKLVNGQWWRVCAAAAAHWPERLLPWFQGSDERINSVLTGQADGGTDESVLDAARAVAAIGVVLASARGSLPRSEAEPAARWAVGYWLTANLLPWQAPTAGTCTDPSPSLRAALDVIATLPKSPARSYVMVLVALMASTMREPKEQREVRVLFDTVGTTRAGLTGLLRLTVLPGGPPGLYPNPRTMSFLRADREFAVALTSAWASAIGSGPAPPCVLWSIAHDIEGIPPVNGGSLGAAFAVALLDLMQQRIRRYLTPWLLQALHSDRAVTGTITPDGEIGPVGGLDRKFEAARNRRWSVVAPLASRADTHRVPDGLSVAWVSDVREARRQVLAWVRWRVALALTIVVVLAAGGTTAWRIAARLSAADTNVSVAQRGTQVQRLLDQADNQRANQPILSLRLGLAADALQNSPYDAAQARAELIQTLTTARPHHAILSGGGPVRAVAIGQHGLTLTVSDTTGVTLWNTSNINQPAELGVLNSSSPQTAAMTGDDRTVVVSAYDDQVRPSIEIWDISDPTHARLTGSAVMSCPATKLAVSTSQPVALTGCTDGAATLWDFHVATAPTKVGTLTSRINDLNAVALDRSGTVAGVASDAGLRVWDIRTPKRPRDITGLYLLSDEGETLSIAPQKVPAYSVALTDFGGSALVGEGGMTAAVVNRLDSSDEIPPKEQVLGSKGDFGSVIAVGLDKNANTAITSGDENTAVVWRADGRGNGYQPFAILRQHTDAVLSAALSPDGRTAVTGGLDGNAIVWDLSTPNPYTRSADLDQFGSDVTAIACSHTTTTCVTVTGDGKAVIWDVSDPSAPQRISGVTDGGAPATATAFAPGSNTVAIATIDGVYLWDLSDPSKPQLLSHVDDNGGPTGAVAFTPDSRSLVEGRHDGLVVLWDLADPGAPRRVGTWANNATPITRIAVEHLGKLIAVAGDDNAVTLVDIADRAHTRSLGTLTEQAGNVLGLAFSPVAPYLLEANDGQSAPVLWDLTDPRNPKLMAQLTGHGATVNSVEYNSSGTMAVTTSQDKTAIVWNVAEPTHPTAMAVLTGHTGALLAAAFSPNGSTVLTSSVDHTSIVWDITDLVSITTDPRRQACAEAGRAFTRKEWNSWVSPGTPYLNNC